MANKILNDLKMHPDSWLLVDTILEGSSNPHTKFYALTILDEAVKVIL
jgi:hypothetical protein